MGRRRREAPEALLSAISALPAEALIERSGLLTAVDYLKHLTSGPERRVFSTSGFRSGVHGGLTNRLIVLTGRAAEYRTLGRTAEGAATVHEALALLEDADEGERGTARRSLPTCSSSGHAAWLRRTTRGQPRSSRNATTSRF